MIWVIIDEPPPKEIAANLLITAAMAWHTIARIKKKTGKIFSESINYPLNNIGLCICHFRKHSVHIFTKNSKRK